MVGFEVIRWCDWSGCRVLILTCGGAFPETRCLAHAAEGRPPSETDVERVGRVCNMLNWRRWVPR